MARIERIFETNVAMRGYYDEGFGRYTDLYARLKGFGGRESESSCSTLSLAAETEARLSQAA